MHGNTCANLAPSLCFAQFPCVTLHNEIKQSDKCVSCDRLNFEYRTFEPLSNVEKAKEYTIFHAIILGKDCLSSHPPHPHSRPMVVCYSPLQSCMFTQYKVLSFDCGLASWKCAKGLQAAHSAGS